MASMPASKAKPLQDMLNKVLALKPPLEVDGVVGPKTTEALKAFQAKAGLKASGELDAETALVVARAMKTGKIEKDPPTIFVDLGGGRYAGFTEKEWAAHKRKVASDLLRGPVREMGINAAAALAEWEHFEDLNNDQYVVSFLIETTRGARLPKRALIDKAIRAHAEMERLAKAEDFAGFAKRAPSAAKEVNEAITEMRAYREQMIEGGGNWITGLEGTKWASFTALSVYFAPVMGAQLGASAVATAVVGGAAVKATESAAGEVGNWAAGNAAGRDGGAVSRVIIDGVVGAFTGFLSKGAAGGKSIVDAFSGKVVGAITKDMSSAIGKKTIEGLATYFINEGGKKMLEGAVSDAAKALKNDPKMTLDTFVSNVASNFLKGCAFGPFNHAMKSYFEGKSLGLASDDAKRLRKGMMDRVAKSLKDTVHVKEFEKMVDKAVDKLAGEILAKAVMKNAEKAAEKVLAGLKGAPDPKALDDAMRKELVTTSVLDAVAVELAKEVEKDLKKGKR